MSSEPNNQSDVSKDSLGKQISSFGYIYWVANVIELIERFAYYGVRVGLPVFIVLAIGKGGPELTQVDKGTIYAVWAVVQCFVPVLSGGFADRFGYKLCIAASALITSTGYLIMGFSIRIAEWQCGMPLAEARPLGIDHVYLILFVGAMFVAVGTGVFKPGVQGLIANQIPKSSASLGWGIFYQMVNVGGFLGPLVAGSLRVLEWEYVFMACAGGALCNLIPLIFFREPQHPEHEGSSNPFVLLHKAFLGLLEPRLFFFTITFAGFWLMFMQLFDLLPNFIDDWVDSRGVASMLTTVFGWFGETASSFVPVLPESGNLTQEWILNFNAMLICLFAFGVAYFTGKMRSLTAIAVGIAIAALAIYGLGMSMNGWLILAAIGLFSLGEMMASPTKMRYLASIAPAGKEGQYMGYANFTVGIGWATGSIAAGYLYEAFGDKAVLARKYLVDTVGMAQSKVAAIPKADLMAQFEQAVHVDQWGARNLLWETYRPYWMWALFAGVGLASMVAILVYTYVCRRADADPRHSLNTHGDIWVLVFLVPICLLFGSLTVLIFLGKHTLDFGLLLITVFFAVMLVILLINMAMKNGSRIASEE
ncbi:MAG: MFS transporter [Pirellulales bacterium]|nr:MFS transporter [Pirellulales bacterium]